MKREIFEDDVPCKLLLKARQKTKLLNAFRNQLAANIKVSKAQISKKIKLGGFLRVF